MGIDNTSARMAEDPLEGLLFLADAMGPGGSDGAIRGMEKRGQQQLVNSDRLPTDCKQDRAAMEALGFTFGDPDPADPMFMPATLPAGWKRQGSDHAMWSHLLDAHGRGRVGIFYKAAFYDRSAFMYLAAVESYVSSHVEYDGPLVITDEWATRETVLSAMREHVASHRKRAAEFRGFAGDTRGRDERNRANCAEYATEHDEKAAKYEAAIAALEGDSNA